MRPEPANDDAELIKAVENENSINYVRLDPETKLPKEDGPQDEKEKNSKEIIILVPALQVVDDNRFFEKLSKSHLSPLILHASVSNEKTLVDMKERNEKKRKNNHANEDIITGIHATYFQEDDDEDNKKGELLDLKREGNVEIENRDDVGTEFTPAFIVVYGANRHKGNENKDDSKLNDGITGRLMDTELFDVEEILQDLDYSVLKFPNDQRNKDYFKEIKKMISRVLDLESPDDVHINPTKRIDGLPNPDGLSFKTYSGEVGVSSMSLGYQTTLAWTSDLAWRLYKNYPESDKPLEEPAIVLIDELDIHLHPSWQLRIMDDLSEVFPNVQFIATSHSPLLVQSSSKTNFAVIQKYKDEVVITNDPVVVKTWRVDQILNSELFGIKTSRDSKTERLVMEKYRILDKRKRTPEDEEKLSKINEEILKLPTNAAIQGEQSAKEFIARAANILKDNGVLGDD